MGHIQTQSDSVLVPTFPPHTFSARVQTATVGRATASFPTQRAGFVMAPGWRRKLTRVKPWEDDGEGLEASGVLGGRWGRGKSGGYPKNVD